MGKVSKEAEVSKALRKALGGITQAELAAKLLLSRNYISQIESSLKTPSPRLLSEMQRMLTESADSPRKVSKPPDPDSPVVLEKYQVTGSYIPEGVDESNSSSPYSSEHLGAERPHPIWNPNRAICDQHFAHYLAFIERLEEVQPGSWLYLRGRLNDHFPLSDFGAEDEPRDWPADRKHCEAYWKKYSYLAEQQHAKGMPAVWKYVHKTLHDKLSMSHIKL